MITVLNLNLELKLIHRIYVVIHRNYADGKTRILLKCKWTPLY